MSRSSERCRILILGGTSEGFDLARRLADRVDLAVVSSLAGRTRRPRLPPGRVRIGGFGGTAGLIHYLSERRIRLVIDASHPFATRISAHAADAAAAAGVALLAVRRPAWPGPGGGVVEADDVAGGLAAAVPLGRRVLVAFRLEDDAPPGGLEIVVRAVEPPVRPPPAGVVWRLGRGPFRAADERRLLEELRIDVVVAKASGGAGAAAKLEAAARLGRPVVLIRRPTPPGAAHVAGGVDEAVRWIDGQLLGRST